MSPEAVLGRLRDVGITVCLDGQAILLRPFSAVPAELVAAAKTCRPALVALLQGGPATQAAPELPARAAEWLAARTAPVPGCVVGVGDAVADFVAYCPDGDPLGLVRALEDGAVPGVRISVTANSARLVVGLRIGDLPILNATGLGASQWLSGRRSAGASVITRSTSATDGGSNAR